VVVLWYFFEKKKSTELRRRFGPEYDATVSQHKSRTQAESELASRLERVEKFKIRPLNEADRTQFLEMWQRNQAHFVDDPGAAIQEADNLVCEVMKARGYPMSDFDRRAEDLSVDHPLVVRNYRAAHEIAERHVRGETDTEDLRRGIVYYRDLFEELLEPQRVRQEVRR
jgi:hypothetical protein